MVRLFKALQEKKSLNITTPARELEVSKRSGSRDVEFMRDRLKLPIEYDALQTATQEVRMKRSLLPSLRL
jgi:hypothetical protein